MSWEVAPAPGSQLRNEPTKMPMAPSEGFGFDAGVGGGKVPNQLVRSSQASARISSSAALRAGLGSAGEGMYP